ILLRQKQKKLIMLPSETMIWQPEFTDKTLSRKPGAVHSPSDYYAVLQYRRKKKWAYTGTAKQHMIIYIARMVKNLRTEFQPSR
ncbi:hypothetical protein Q5444_25320, partial [Escherichia coli]|uniref:hypothetical protein n=2 Tax=Escherichia coli TaxID=562 RepID=UPI001ABC8969